MRKVRVLVVDDSTVIRRLVTDSLAVDPELEIAGTAANGKIALAKIPQVNPDIITLDIEMPEMNGIETLIEVRKKYPKLPVIMFSTLTERGAEITLDALSKGANDYVTKPANVGSVTTAMDRVRTELGPKIKALCPWSRPVPPPIPLTPRPTSLTSKSVTSSRSQSIDVIAIGSSTGGPNALQSILTQLPKDFPVPIVVVQHMPPVFTRHLADRLNQLCGLQVYEAKDGDTVHAGGVWIAPGDYHMTIGRNGVDYRVALNQGTQENSCRPAVDVLFRSVAELYGNRTLAVVLTGMGQDGARGCDTIQSKGGQIVIQDEPSSVVWGMPGAVSRAGLADATLPLNQIALELIRRSRVGRTIRTLEGAK